CVNGDIGYSRESGDVSMRIAVMAAGGVGGYFGARLAAAGEDVHFIARGAHFAALRDKGLTLNSANGDLHLQSVSATDDPAQIGPVDIVIVAVKQYDTEAAAKLIRPLIGADTAAIALQNGMERDERLRAVLGRDHVMDGAAYIGGAGVASPGVITHVGKVARIIFRPFIRARRIQEGRSHRTGAVEHKCPRPALLSRNR